MKEQLEKIVEDCKGLSKKEISEKINLLKQFPVQTPEIKEVIQRLQQMM